MGSSQATPSITLCNDKHKNFTKIRIKDYLKYLEIHLSIEEIEEMK